MTTKKTQTIPKTTGACIDLLYDTKQKRLELQRQVKEIEEFEKTLKDHLINTLPKDDATGAAGKKARVAIVTKEKLVAEDWDKIHAYVKKNNAFDLLQKRLNESALQERIADGKKIPGLGKFIAVDVSLTKI